MKRITLKKSNEIYNELKFHKKDDVNHGFAGVYIHDGKIKIGYNNRYGKSDFIHNNEKRLLIIDDELANNLLNNYYKKDAVKFIHYVVNDYINYYNEKEGLIC